MSDVAAYHVFVRALFPVQGGMWNCICTLCKKTQNCGVWHRC